MANISIQNLVKKYTPASDPVLSDINLEIADGEFVVLVGPSGCGKTTLLRIIAGLEGITSGDVHIGETRVNDLSPAQRDIAFVFQDYALYPHFTVRENMAFGLEIRNTPKDEIEKRIKYAAGFLQIEHLLNRKPRALSGGQRQRVAMGRAIVRQPKAFLFDEPLSNLDAKLRVEVRTEIRRLFQELKTTMVYVTHDQVEAMTMADRIVVLKDSLIQQVGSPDEIYSSPCNRFVAEFIGSPSMNFFDALYDGGSLELGGSGVKIPVSPHLKEALDKHDDKALTLGIRPEDFQISPDGPIKLCVNVVEPLGSDTLVFCPFDGKDFVIRVNPNVRPKVGMELHFDCDTAKLRAFCNKTGQALVC